MISRGPSSRRLRQRLRETAVESWPAAHPQASPNLSCSKVSAAVATVNGGKDECAVSERMHIATTVAIRGEAHGLTFVGTCQYQ